ncbi:MAG: hypothetical protein WDK95_15750 [Syntrophorhabdaceae bacterium]
MNKKSKTNKRTDFIDAIFDCMKNHEYFSDDFDRRKEKEGGIQKVFFSKLERSLPKLYVDKLGKNSDEAQKMTKETFIYEKKKKIILHNFNYFGTSHRPDAQLEIDKNVSLVIEIKKGDKGTDIRAGIGQSLIYSQKYDFVLFVFVDTSPERTIRNAVTAEEEKSLINSLWDNYNIRFRVL